MARQRRLNLMTIGVWRRGLALAIVAAALMVQTQRVQASIPQPGLADLIETLMPTVVNITSRSLVSDNPNRAVGDGTKTVASEMPSEQRVHKAVGSGFVIDPDGLIVTNNHVIENAFDITVTFQDGTVAHADLVASTKVADIALLKVSLNRKLKAAHFDTAYDVRVGDAVIAIGNPLGYGGSVSAGIVSAVNRDAMLGPADHFIQTDAAINHGNSGGPLFDMQGDVIGINTAIVTPADNSGSIGIGFAIPAPSAAFIVEQLRKFGQVRFGDLGVSVQDVNGDIAIATGLPDAMGTPAPGQDGFGVITTDIVQGGSAAMAGLREGDIILSINDQPIQDSRAFVRMVAQLPLDSQAALSVWRDRKQMLVNATVREWLSVEKIDRAAFARSSAPPKMSRDLGLELAALTPALRAARKIPDGIDGVLITHVDLESVAADRGLAEGNVIEKIMGRPVRQPDEVLSNLNGMFDRHRRMVLMLVRNDVGLRWVALPLLQPETAEAPK